MELHRAKGRKGIIIGGGTNPEGQLINIAGSNKYICDT